LTNPDVPTVHEKQLALLRKAMADFRARAKAAANEKDPYLRAIKNSFTNTNINIDEFR
jgi:hypothetical protein